MKKTLKTNERCVFECGRMCDLVRACVYLDLGGFEQIQASVGVVFTPKHIKHDHAVTQQQRNLRA